MKERIVRIAWIACFWVGVAIALVVAIAALAAVVLLAVGLVAMCLGVAQRAVQWAVFG